MALSFEQFYDKYGTKSGGAPASSPNTQTTFREYYEKYGNAGSGSTDAHSPKTFRQFYQDAHQDQANFIGKKIDTAVSDLESSKITADAFKSRIEPYRSYLGDDATNQLVAVGNQKGVQDIAKSFEDGKISAGEFKEKIEGYRSYLGDDTANQLITGADQYGRE